MLGRKLEVIVADEGEAATEGPKVGIAAVNKLTGEDRVNVLDRRLRFRRHARRAAAHRARQDDLPRHRLGLARDPGEGQGGVRALQVHLPRQSDQFGQAGQRAPRFHQRKAQRRSRIETDRDPRRERQMGAGHGAVDQEGRRGGRPRGPARRILRRADRRLLAHLRQGQGQRLAVPGPDHLARRIRRLRQAMVRRQGPGADRRHRREEHGCEFLRARGRQVDRRSVGELRRARAAHAEHGRRGGTRS